MTEMQARISQTEILADFLFVWKTDNKSGGKQHAAHWRIQVNFWDIPNPILQGVVSREVIHLHCILSTLGQDFRSLWTQAWIHAWSTKFKEPLN